jgi:hypothetical protein
MNRAGGKWNPVRFFVKRLRADFALQRLVEAERLPYVRLETVGKRADIVTNIIFMVTKQQK